MGSGGQCPQGWGLVLGSPSSSRAVGLSVGPPAVPTNWHSRLSWALLSPGSQGTSVPRFCSRALSGLWKPRSLPQPSGRAIPGRPGLRKPPCPCPCPAPGGLVLAGLTGLPSGSGYRGVLLSPQERVAPSLAGKDKEKPPVGGPASLQTETTGCCNFLWGQGLPTQTPGWSVTSLLRALQGGSGGQVPGAPGALAFPQTSERDLSWCP